MVQGTKPKTMTKWRFQKSRPEWWIVSESGNHATERCFSYAQAKHHFKSRIKWHGDVHKILKVRWIERTLKTVVVDKLKRTAKPQKRLCYYQSQL